jgi:hypothetical protein
MHVAKQVGMGLVLGMLLGAGGACEPASPSDAFPELHLGDQQAFALMPSSTSYSYTFKIPPQGATRYDATLTLAPTDAGKRFRARLATNCSQETKQPDEVSSTTSSAGTIVFRWSAFTSTQFAQIASDEAEPFELHAEMTGMLQPAEPGH